MFKKSSFIILFCIIVLGAFLRLYQIDTAPPGLLVDEPNIGYNAYSILKTGKDEFGKPFPLSFRSYGDQKLPAYIYADVLPVKILGLTPLAVRLPAILSGIIVIFLAYLLLRLLKFQESVNLLGALVTAVSPWTIVLSRYAWESSVAFVIFFVAILCAIQAYRSSKTIYFILTAFFLGLSWYGYLPFRPVAVMLLALGTIWLLKLKKATLKNLAIAWLVFFVIILPLMPIIFSKEGNLHASSNTVFSQSITPIIVNENRTYCTQQYPKILCYLNSNKATEYGLAITHNFVKLFSADFLFFRGEEEKYFSTDNFGLLPFILLPFYFLGIFLVFKNLKKRGGKELLLLLSLLIAILPSAVSDPQRVRLATVYPFMLIVIAMGFESAQIFLKKSFYEKMLRLALAIYGLYYIFNFTAIQVPKYFDRWQFIGTLNHYLGQVDRSTPIFIKPVYAHPIMYYAFYNQIDPVIYQNTAQTSTPETNGYFMVTHMGNMTVSTIALAQARCQLPPNSLYVTDEKMPLAKPIYTAKSSSGIYDLAYVYEVKNIPLPQKGCP